MKKIGITGTIGSGKSFVGALLREQGFAVLDADLKVHELYRDCTELRAEMSAEFGEGILTADGVDRVALANKIFTDACAQKKLEFIVYPHLTAAVHEFFAAENFSADGASGTPTDARNEKPRFLEAALLAKVPSVVAELDEIWLVDAPEDLRLIRLQSRGLTCDDAKRRIENQRGACDASLFAGKTVRYVINDSDRDSLLNLLQKTLSL